jgi:hypothetical protein
MSDIIRRLKINAVCDLVNCLNRQDLIAIIAMIGHPENKKFKLSQIGNAVIAIVRSLDEDQDQEAIDDLFNFCVGRLYHCQMNHKLQMNHLAANGDSLPFPQVTKEQLDKELDEMVKARKRFVNFFSV